MRRWPFVAVALLALLLAVALHAGRTDRASAPSTTRHAVLSGQHGAGRPFLLHAVHRPPGPRPLVLMLHGWGQAPEKAERMSGASGSADRHGFAVAYPVGRDEAWNAGGCCGQARGDDVGYLVDVVEAAARLTAVDRRRVYLWGFSNGGMMAWRAGRARPDVFAAVGVVAGALLVPCPATVAVRHLHGAGDEVVPYRGGHSALTGATLPDSSTEPRRVGRGSTVSTTVLPGLGHAWPTPANEARRAGADALWRFVSAYHLRR